MEQHAVDLATDERGVLFDAHEEAASVGWTTEDPYPKLLKIMEGPPVQKGSLEDLMDLPSQMAKFWEGRDIYTVLSFDTVNAAFLDGETYTNQVYEDLTLTRLGDTLLNMDGERHTRMRNIAKPWFKPGFAQTWWNDNWIVEAVDELFARITAKDRADLNLELCAPLPMSVVSIGFGVPTGEALALRSAVHEVVTHASAESVAAGNAEIRRILLAAIAARRAAPRDDLISKMIEAELELEDGGSRKLADDEILRYCLLIVFAGGGTTWRQLGITIMALLDNPEQMEALRNDRSLLRPAIQESTRWYPTDPVFQRWVAKDTVLGGVEMKAGSVAYLCVAAANRDRSQWADPDRFDIRRPQKRHFAFGAGAHACLGQHLSRQEMEVALNAVLDRLPNLRWDPDKPRAKTTGGTLVGRGPDALNVRFDPA
jgi:cytochrome P450